MVRLQLHALLESNLEIKEITTIMNPVAIPWSWSGKAITKYSLICPAVEAMQICPGA